VPTRLSADGRPSLLSKGQGFPRRYGFFKFATRRQSVFQERASRKQVEDEPQEPWEAHPPHNILIKLIAVPGLLHIRIEVVEVGPEALHAQLVPFQGVEDYCQKGQTTSTLRVG
jgi:hypothetical protein